MPYAMKRVNQFECEELIAQLACERQESRTTIRKAAISRGALTLADGRKLIADSARWFLGTPVEAK